MPARTHGIGGRVRLRAMRWIVLVSLFACSAPATKSVSPAASAVQPPSALAAATTALPAPTPPGLRLPAGVRPTRYALDLTVVPTSETFAGRATIGLSIEAPTQVVWLHGIDLTIKTATIKTPRGTVAARAITPTPKTKENEEYIGFVVDAPVSGSAELAIEYEGKIYSNDSDGIYRVEDRGNWYVYTQFEATDARRAFPSFDEPSFKVPLQLTMRVKAGDVAVANTPAVSERDAGNGMKVVTFAPTKPLPTYLIALAVGPFEIVDGGKAGKNQTPLRVITPKGRADEAAYATKVTPQIVENLEKYFGSPYPYEKLDQIAVPRKGGAMENAGLVTYAMPLLLIPRDEETISRKRRFASVAAHELAHQWFGNLVTLAWWDDLWLNEAFASWMEDKVVMELQPTWDIDVSLVEQLSGAMDSDSLATARKIRQPITSKDDIAAAFDGITYGKGSAVIGMLERWIGAEKLQAGLRLYMEQHAHGTATTADFLAAISQMAGVDVAPVFSSFLDQIGTPLVTAELSCGGGGAKLVLAQQRYRPLGSKAEASQTWNVPVCARYPTAKGEARACTLLAEPKGELALPGASCPAWVLANEGQLGYYRVHYQGDMHGKLLAVKTLTMPERVGLLGDLAALVESGHMPVGKALERLPALAKDSNRHMTSAMFELMWFVAGDTVPKQLRPNRARFVRKLLRARARDIGWAAAKGEPDDRRLMRPTLLGWVANTGEDPEQIATAKKLAEKWLVDHKAVDPDVAGLALKVAARYGDKALFERFRAAAKAEKDHKERSMLLGAMGAFRNPEIVKVALQIPLTDEFETRDSVTLVWGAFGEEETRELAYQFVKTNLDALLARLPRDYGTYFVGMATSFCDEAHRDDSLAFFKDRAPAYLDGPRALARMVERTDLCIARRAAWRPSLVEFLSRQ
jgi:alanyl aminopeptidase